MNFAETTETCNTNFNLFHDDLSLYDNLAKTLSFIFIQVCFI